MNPAKRLTALLCVLALMLTLSPAAFAAGTPAASSNINQQDQTDYRGSTVKSYLYENGQGGLTRVEYTGNQVVVEDYDSSFALQNSRTLSMELPIWGGFFAGSDANYLIFGQSNDGESSSAEVMRVVQYSKDWQRQGQASVLGANTRVPFKSGSLRCAEYGGFLYIRTCHGMFQTSDGMNHQANMTVQIQESGMTVVDSFCDVMNVSVGYVSHSFNQFILIDQDHNIIAADHGDTYPRGLVLVKYHNKAGSPKFQGNCTSSIIQTFAGPAGQNCTGASLGGLAETTGGYVTAYNYDGAAKTGPRDVYLGFTAKNGLTSKATKISGTSGSTTPVLAPAGLDGGYVMWNAKSGGGNTLYYAAYSGDGSVGAVKTAAAPLSDCQPISYNGQMVWYVTNKSAPTFYGLDSSGVHVLNNAASAAPAAPAKPAAPTAPADPGKTSPFTDVPSNAYYYDAVLWAVENGVTSGVTPTEFQPDAPCTRGQVMTFLWRANGSPEPKTKTNPFTDVSSSSPFCKAILWAYENGITSGSTPATFNPGGTCSSGQVITFLWRANGEPAASGSSAIAEANPGRFYTNAAAWAESSGLLSGVGSAFNPDAQSPRADIMTYLYRNAAD